MNTMLKGILLSLITLLMIWGMAKTGHSLKTEATPLGILNLEIARSNNEVIQIVQQWNHLNLIPIVKKNTYYDFIFLASYTALFFFLLRQIAKQFKPNTFSRNISFVLSHAALLAGIMDILENTGMLLSLSGHIYNSITIFTFTSSIIKWFLVVLIITWILSAGIILLYQRLWRKNKIDSAFAK